MPAPKMLAGLPKPVLFGLYGAIGGLLGALVFGELIWLVLSPAKAQSSARVAVSASKDLQLFQSGTNRLFVQIARDGFDGEVVVRLEGLPAGVTASEATIPAKETEGEIELRATADAGAPSTPVKVKATAKPGGGEVSDSTTLNLSVSAPGTVQTDIVFVLDVTGSMQQQINGLQRGINTLARALASAKVDARFACVCFRDLFVPEPAPLKTMEVLKFKGETFTSDANAFSFEVGKQQAAGGGDVPETSFEAISAAAELREWRKSATRVLVLITDAPPKLDFQAKPPGGQSVKDTVDSLQRNKIELLHLVIGDPNLENLRIDPDLNNRIRNYYREVQKGAIGVTAKDGSVDRGKEFDLAQVARNAEEMTRTLLPEMTRAIIIAAEAKRPDSKPELGARPEGAVIKGVQSSDSYDASAGGQLVLAVGVWTGAIAALVCLFLLGGQHHYLRGTLPSAGGVLAGLGGGLLVGLIGGAAGQGLFMLAKTDYKIVEIIFRVMGWTILGAMAGAGLSLFVPNLKLAYGLAGGAIGGAVGAIGYIAIEAIASRVLGSTAGGIMGRLAGGFALGLFIGLMVAVVEAAFRRAWLEVRYGPREMVTVNLGAEPVKVGSDSRACTVWARGAAEVELRYFIRDGQVICTDVPAREEEVVRDGDTREAGNVTVTVRTGSGKAPAEPDRRRKAAPPPPPKKKPRAEPRPEERRPEPMSLDDDFDDGLPQPVPPPPPPVQAPPPAPPRPVAAPAPPPRPQAPAAPPPRPAAPAPSVTPAIKSTARDPDACPSCGRKNAGRPGSRYCMVCDQTY